MSTFSDFANQYRRFLKLLEMTDRWSPVFAKDFVACWLGRLASPYRLHSQKIVKAMQVGLGLSHEQALMSWRHWRESHGQFCLSILSYPKWTPSILQHGLTTTDRAILNRAASTGGLLLTYHSHHHNSLFCLLGFAGARISVLAASEEGSPLFPAIGHYIQRVNRGSSLHFGGGAYLFTDNLRALVKVVKAEFDSGALVASLCDVSGGQLSSSFLGRQVAPPMGAITLALKQNVPIYTAILYGGHGKNPILRMREIDCNGGEVKVLQQYFSFLTDVVKEAPSAWQGWDWFSDFPLAPEKAETRDNSVETTEGK